MAAPTVGPGPGGGGVGVGGGGAAAPSSAAVSRAASHRSTGTWQTSSSWAAVDGTSSLGNRNRSEGVWEIGGRAGTLGLIRGLN